MQYLTSNCGTKPSYSFMPITSRLVETLKNMLFLKVLPCSKILEHHVTLSTGETRWWCIWCFVSLKFRHTFLEQVIPTFFLAFPPFWKAKIHGDWWGLSLLSQVTIQNLPSKKVFFCRHFSLGNECFQFLRTRTSSWNLNRMDFPHVLAIKREK